MKRSIFMIAFLAFILRLGLGIAGSTLLPSMGYESKPQQAGYLFFDAYRRDMQAWDLAQSSKPLSRAFESKFSSDQYGGLLWISAFTYRYLSASEHQPILVILLAALMGSLGVFFVYLSTRHLLDEKSALLTSMFFAFFPEAVLLGASQMREPFLMTFIAMAFYGLTEWQATSSKKPWFWIVLSLSGMLLISPGFVVVALLTSAGWLFFANSSDQKLPAHKIPWQVIVGAAGLLVLALVMLSASWDSLITSKGSGVLGIIGNWARETAHWNAYLLGRSSGIVQLLFKALPSALALPFVAIYGVLQPVLPAVLLEPGIPFWQFLGFFRALGWWLTLPLVAYAPLATGILPAIHRRRQWVWLSLVVWVWILIAALRGGGDQWDNPRYRVILLPWISILAALGFKYMKSNASRWLWRICCVETIILVVFGHWYSWRYLGIGFNIGIRNTLSLAIGLSLLIVLGDVLLQRNKPSTRL